jgi:hypothetical protein
VIKNRQVADCILCVCSHIVPGFTIFFVYSPAPVGLRPFRHAIAMCVPIQGTAGDITVAFSQGMAKPSNLPSSDLKVTIRLISYLQQLCYLIS